MKVTKTWDFPRYFKFQSAESESYGRTKVLGVLGGKFREGYEFPGTSQSTVRFDGEKTSICIPAHDIFCDTIKGNNCDSGHHGDFDNIKFYHQIRNLEVKQLSVT